MPIPAKKKQGTAAAISTDADIYLYDIVSGKTENLTQGNGGYDTNPAWSPDGRFLAWLSMDEDGYEADKNDIKILEWATGRTYNLTERWDETVEAFAWEKNSLSLVFRTAFNAVEQLFEYSLPKDLDQLAPNQDITQLTKEKTCTGAFIPTGKYIIAERYDFNRPNELVAYDLKRKNHPSPYRCERSRDAVHRSLSGTSPLGYHHRRTADARLDGLPPRTSTRPRNTPRCSFAAAARSRPSRRTIPSVGISS